MRYRFASPCSFSTRSSILSCLAASITRPPGGFAPCRCRMASSYLVLVTDTQREGGMALTMMQGPKAGLGGLAGLRASSSPQVAMAPVRPGEYAEPKPFFVLRRSRRGCGTLLRASRIGGCGSRGAIFAPPAPAGTGWGYDMIERIETLQQFLEPFRTLQRRSFSNPLIEVLGVGLRGISENDAVLHASSESFSRISQGASLSRPPRRPRRA